MTVNTTNITGFVVLPNDTIREKSSIIFRMTGFDTDADQDAVVVPYPITAPIAVDGSIDVDLWPNPEGVRTTFYQVTASLYNGVNPVSVDLGRISVPVTGGPFDLNDLLPVAPPAGASVEDYIAFLAAAVASAEDAADRAEADAVAAAISAESIEDLFSSYILASDYGFDVANTAAENAAAMELAIDAATTGKRIYVFAETDFECGNFNVRDQHFDIEYLGQGKWVDGGQLFTVVNDFTDVQDILSITEKNVTQDGSSVWVTEIEVSDASAYNVADVIKVVSDDLDTLNGKTDRRIGQWHAVASVSGNLIRVQGELAHDFATNPRIGILPKYRTRIWGLKVKSSKANTSSLMSINGIYHGRFNMEVEGEHGDIAVNHSGYRSHFVDCVFGRMKADSSGSLGYGINDVSSFETLILRPVGYNARHVVTTNHNSVDAGGNLRTYGRSFGHTVKDGVAYGCQGTPWDDHDGSMNSKWINCKAYGGANSSSAYTAAFQLRGVNSQVIDCECDNTYEAFVRVVSVARGDMRIVNGYSRADLGLFVDGVVDDVTVTWLGGVMERVNGQEVVYLEGGRTTISGGALIRNKDITRGSSSAIVMEDTSLHLGDVTIEIIADAGGVGDNNTQIIRCEGTSNNLTGSFNLRHENIATFEAIIDDDSTTSMFADIDVTIQSGGVIPDLFSTPILPECTGSVTVVGDLEASYQYNSLFNKEWVFTLSDDSADSFVLPYYSGTGSHYYEFTVLGTTTNCGGRVNVRCGADRVDVSEADSRPAANATMIPLTGTTGIDGDVTLSVVTTSGVARLYVENRSGASINFSFKLNSNLADA